MKNKMNKNNIIVKNAEELVTSSGFKAKAGKEMKEINVINDGCVVITNGIIEKVGPTKEVLKDFDLKGYEVIDATGKTVLPGFVDSHTHFIFGGYRDKEFNMRLNGASYTEIAQAGGGIISTVENTRNESFDELYNSGYKRLDSMIDFGVTTVEGKSGYGLDVKTELKQLEVMKKLDENHPVDVIRTYMGAHEVPVEYKGRTDEFVDFLIEEGLPSVKEKDLAEFCDIFTEEGVFNIEQSRKLLTAASDLGFKLKMHADEIVPIGGAELAAELKVTSADHLLKASDEGLTAMKDNNVVATLLPGTAFSLKEDFARARFIIDNGGILSLASDYNPGSCHTNSIPLTIALATIYMKMTIEETITALTLNAAAAINREEEVGSLDIGKKGDVVIIDAPSYNFLSYTIGVNLVDTVIKDGHVVLSK